MVYSFLNVDCLSLMFITVFTSVSSMYRLENEANGSAQYRNPRGSHIEPERIARGFYGDARVSIPRRSRWTRSLTGLEYSNHCYPIGNFRRCANVL